MKSAFNTNLSERHKEYLSDTTKQIFFNEMRRIINTAPVCIIINKQGEMMEEIIEPFRSRLRKVTKQLKDYQETNYPDLFKKK